MHDQSKCNVPIALWECLFASRSHKSYGNDVVISQNSSLQSLLVRVFPQRLWECCIYKVYQNLGLLLATHTSQNFEIIGTFRQIIPGQPIQILACGSTLGQKLGSQPIPHLVDSVSRSSILLKEMLPLAIYRPNPQPTFTANSLGWSSNHLPSWGQAHTISLLDYNSHLPSQQAPSHRDVRSQEINFPIHFQGGGSDTFKGQTMK